MKKNLWNLYENKTLNQIGTISKLISEQSSLLGYSELFKNSIEPKSKLMLEQMNLASVSTFGNHSFASSKLFGDTVLDQIGATSKLISEQSSLLGYSELFKNSIGQLGATSKSIFEQMNLASVSTFGNHSFASSKLFGDTVLDQIGATSKLISEQSSLLGYSELFKNSIGQLGATSKSMFEQMNLANVSTYDLVNSQLFGKTVLDQIGVMSKLISEQPTVAFTSELILKQISLLENSSILDKNIDNLSDMDEKFISQISEALFEVFPQLNTIKNTLSKKQYIKMCIHLIVSLISIYIFILGVMDLLKDESLNSYITNRNNVIVRSEPSTKKPESIIIELKKNYYVEKIDSYKNWIKIEFENENGELLEGWITNDMLRKIEN